MNIYEHIISMNIDELTDLLAYGTPCDRCVCEGDDDSCMAIGCYEGVKRYLLQEYKGDK